MQTKPKIWKELRHQQAQYRATMKKRKKAAKQKRHNHIHERKIDRYSLQKAIHAQPSIMTAPSNFSFVDNTNEMIGYINSCKDALHKNKKIKIDISKIEHLSPDAITLLVANVNDKKFSGKYGQIEGNAPECKDLAKLFVESGFYQYVKPESRVLQSAKNEKENLLHRESHVKVEPNLAAKACRLGMRHVMEDKYRVPELYEMLVEAMSNTNNHANKQEVGTTKWWLYTYNAPEGITCYSFIDLGVGIFDSLPVARYKRITNFLRITHNADLVPDLLDGKIKSSEKIDQEVRGKGIPQIANNSQIKNFGRAYIISNNVKIDLKTRTAERLEYDFKGTFLYWELINPK